MLIAACGGSEDGTTETITTTPTTTEGTTTPGDTPADASSDAAAAVPGDQSEVEGAQPAADEGTAPATTTTSTTTTTTTPPTDISGTALPPTTTTTVTPAITPPVSSSLDSTSTGAVLSRPFSSTSPWNTDVSGEPLDPDSKAMMRRAQKRLAAVEQPNGTVTTEERKITVGLTVNVTRWTVPVFSDNQPGAVSRPTVCRQLTCGSDATTSITIPEDACPDPRFDGWMTVLDTGAHVAYDYWRARCEADGSISYHYVKAWELDGPGFQDPTGVSARGSGLPLFAGLITPQEVESGRIEHALAISVPGAAQRRYVQPASRTDGTGARNSVPEGARLRLRDGAEDLLTRKFVRSGTQRETARTIISALQRYGAIIVDRSAAPTMYAQRNADWTDTLPLNLLQDIPLSRFDVVDLPKVHFDPPREGEEQFPAGTPESIPGTSSGSQGEVTP
ncbi:MAG: DUF2155 domain-containing protein [Solirubrobacterales bacterium]|nr:DUF2155 domain-containing protein [Solirubrobacterales bacterium]